MPWMMGRAGRTDAEEKHHESSTVEDEPAVVQTHQLAPKGLALVEKAVVWRVVEDEEEDCDDQAHCLTRILRPARSVPLG